MEPGRPRRRAEVLDVDLDVSWLVPADLGAVDALARLQVTATRRGRSLQLHGACGGLPELLEFLGLVDVLSLCACCDSYAEEPGANTEG
jgi:ABC-type transporter Mla MlaB component